MNLFEAALTFLVSIKRTPSGFKDTPRNAFIQSGALRFFFCVFQNQHHISHKAVCFLPDLTNCPPPALFLMHWVQRGGCSNPRLHPIINRNKQMNKSNDFCAFKAPETHFLNQPSVNDGAPLSVSRVASSYFNSAALCVVWSGRSLFEITRHTSRCRNVLIGIW